VERVSANHPKKFVNGSTFLVSMSLRGGLGFDRFTWVSTLPSLTLYGLTEHSFWAKTFRPQCPFRVMLLSPGTFRPKVRHCFNHNYPDGLDDSSKNDISSTAHLGNRRSIHWATAPSP